MTKGLGRKSVRIGLSVGVGLATMATGAVGGMAQASAASANKSTIDVEAITDLASPEWDEVGGAQAEFKWVNAHGGIDGHPVHLKVCYAGTLTEASSSEAAGCAQQAVSNHVLAIVGGFSPYDSSVFPILGPAHIADFGNFPLSPADNTNADSFPLLIPITFFSVGLSQELAQQGHCKTIVALAPSGEPTTPSEVAAVNSGTRLSGAKVAPAVLVSSTETDLAPTVAKIDSENADCVADLLNTDSVALIKAINESGVPLKVSGIGPTFSPQVIKALGSLANGIYVDQTAQVGAQVTDAGAKTPQEKLAYKQMQKYDPSRIQDGNSEWPSYGAAVGFGDVVKYMVAHKIALTSANFEKSIPKTPIVTNFFPTVRFGQKAPVPGYPRIHNTFVNYLQVDNGNLVAVTAKNYSVAPALIKYPKG